VDAATLARDKSALKRYVVGSLFETVLARDVLQLQTINKPAARCGENPPPWARNSD
jgi:hypothetical protein